MDFNDTWHKYSSCECALLKDFQGQRSKIIARPDALFVAEAHISTVWCRGWVVTYLYCCLAGK